MLQGLRTVIYTGGDLDSARSWYAVLLGGGPYFDEPFYVGFDVGGYELGLIPGNDGGDHPSAGQSYWGVPDCRAAWESLLTAGAQPVEEPQDVGGGIVTAVVRDPAGKPAGIIENPHFGA